MLVRRPAASQAWLAENDVGIPRRVRNPRRKRDPNDPAHLKRKTPSSQILPVPNERTRKQRRRKPIRWLGAKHAPLRHQKRRKLPTRSARPGEKQRFFVLQFQLTDLVVWRKQRVGAKRALAKTLKGLFDWRGTVGVWSHACLPQKSTAYQYRT